MEYVEASSNEMDIKIELSVLRNPRKHYSRLHPRTTHPPTQERYKKAFRRSVRPGRPAGRTPSAHFHSKRQPTVATTHPACRAGGREQSTGAERMILGGELDVPPRLIKISSSYKQHMIIYTDVVYIPDITAYTIIARYI